MSNYVESNKELNRIKSKYSCAGDVLFRTAIQCVVEYGTSNLIDDWSYEHLKCDINGRYDDAKAGTRKLELVVLECAREIARVNINDLLVYIQKEVWLGGNGISYQRAIEIIGTCLIWAANNDCCGNREILDWFRDNFDLTDYEIVELGFGWVFDEEEE